MKENSLVIVVVYIEEIRFSQKIGFLSTNDVMLYDKKETT